MNNDHPKKTDAVARTTAEGTPLAEDSMQATTWQNYVGAFNTMVSARMSVFTSESSELVAAGRRSLDDPNDRAAAIAYVSLLSPKRRLIYLRDLVEIAIYVNGLAGFAQEALASMPRHEVLAGIDAFLPEILDREDYEEYRGLLGLFELLGDSERAAAVAARARRSTDSDVREVGESFLVSSSGMAETPAKQPP